MGNGRESGATGPVWGAIIGVCGGGATTLWHFCRPLAARYRCFRPVRLHTLKLSGFKSFAEPTTLHLPGQLVGVVGPNGCGKSNIMDAVRWVLGESKASELRGESMQDVIFNGTTTRKPASRASVELVFDNASQRAGGQWNQYAEIAVKRVLTRDGTSTYYINQQAVRRRDVQDVFLGTGLGPRAYAIIGQGTISRIIESRPEELRLFLEEAAGVSKYKERRRETANRLADTRDNLTRVEDILRELNSQLAKLEQQAEVASRYHALQTRATLRQQQLWWLKRRDAAAELAQVQAAGREAVNALEARLADLRRVEAELETLRQAHYDAGEGVNQAQGQLYEAGAEVARLEAEIRYVVEGRQRVQQRLLQLQAQQQDWAARQEAALAELDTLAETAASTSEQHELLQAQHEEQADRLPELEDALRLAQGHAQQQRHGAAHIEQTRHVLAAEQRGLQEQDRQLRQRHARLSHDRATLRLPDAAALAQTAQQAQDAQHEHATAQARLEALQVQQTDAEAQRRAAQARVTHEHQTLADVSARLQALQALQQQVQTDGKLQPWLQRHGLHDLPALWRQLQVEPGWENALEAALRERMGALPVSAWAQVAALASDAPPAKLAFFHAPDAPPPLAPDHLPGALPLARQLRLHDATLHGLLAHWLHGCHTVATLADALALQPQLQPGHTLFTPEGHAVGRYHVGFYAPDNAQAGLLARAHDIDNLDKQQRAQTMLHEEASRQLQRTEATCTELQQQLAQARRAATDAQQRLHRAELDAQRLAQLDAQGRERNAQLAQELAELEHQLEALQERGLEAEAQLDELEHQLTAQQAQQLALDDAVTSAERHLTQAREQLRTLERQAQESAFAQRSLDARRLELQRAADTATQQQRTLADDTQRAHDELARLSDAAAQGGLQAALDAKLQRERDLAAQRSRYDALTVQLRATDERRQTLERELEPLRARITECQLQEQAAQLGLEQYAQRLAEAGADLDALATSIEQDGIRLQGLQAEIDRCQRDMAALGAVNLAALDELAAARERQQFLSEQSTDLHDAMRTLEDAIAKIDAETRQLLGHTFDTVNQHFGRMFPELFGGGQARLVMTGDEILDTGVQVLAQPPGKKNQTIHLLSGGEKALTAIALVFAIFQLNPAPFCLLDEVDAPLDDSNTERYARLVTQMSRETQFLFISHNKIAMEMAQQLIGVTMQEQGVSRMVAVDMETARGWTPSA